MEGQLLIITHSNCLKMSFFDESYPPTLKRGSSAIEDPIISLFSNLPCSSDKDIHEEFIMEMGTGLLHN
jgi:hypothetical protein